MSMSSCAEQRRDARLLGRVVVDDQQALAARRGERLDARQRVVEAVGGRRLADERERAAREAVLAVLVQRHDLHRDVARRRIALELAEHRPSEHVGQEHVERDRGRAGTRARARARPRRVVGDEHLEAVGAREVDDHARVARIVLDDQHASGRRAARSSRSSGIDDVRRLRCGASRGSSRARAPARRRPPSASPPSRRARRRRSAAAGTA